MGRSVLTLPMADLPFCDRCGRRLEPSARFCDQCGRKIAFEEAPLPPPSYEIVLGEEAPRPPAAAREPSAVEQKAPEPRVESKPAESRPPPPPSEARPRLVRPRRFHITRRALAFSVAGVAVIVIVALAFLSGPVVFPPLSGTGTQTTSQTVATQPTGPALQVEINVAYDPVTPGSMQEVIITVHDLNGNVISSASVLMEIVYPSGESVTLEGVTDANGQFTSAFRIAASADSIGTFQVRVSATMAGYEPGQAQATFQVAPSQ